MYNDCLFKNRLLILPGLRPRLRPTLAPALAPSPYSFSSMPPSPPLFSTKPPRHFFYFKNPQHPRHGNRLYQRDLLPRQLIETY